MGKQQLIRNLAIIAHIDHGKSTLADRLLEFTGTVNNREMREQYLDSMDLERERGITIKLKPVRMSYVAADTGGPADIYQINLIDTPGHVDFGYEVSRSLAACEGAILVVDATQGIQAQTVANVQKALDAGLKIIPFINKIDLAGQRTTDVLKELTETFGFDSREMIPGSAKEGLGINELLRAIVERVPAPRGQPEGPFRALIFDSVFDEHKGVIAFVRVVDGGIDLTEGVSKKVRFLAEGFETMPVEIGFFRPQMTPASSLVTGEIGYIATGLKEIRRVRVGDTLTDARTASAPLPGYKEPKPMVFLGLYPLKSDDFLKFRSSLQKLKLSDSSLSCETESSGALGTGFRCGFLGLLHADIVQERLEREYQLNLISTIPSVPYQVKLTDGRLIELKRVSGLPDASRIKEILEPYVRLFIYVPTEFVGNVLKLVGLNRGSFRDAEYHGRVVRLVFEIPLSSIISDFYDSVKSVSSGFASVDYEIISFRPGDLARLDIRVAGEIIEPLSQIVPRDRAGDLGRKLLLKFKETIRPHQFVVVLQASIGGKIVARQEIPALRKNVLSKMSGGHRERKDKLLMRQREGKKRLKKMGRVEIPQEAFRTILSLR